jgi:hypothetical protein
MSSEDQTKEKKVEKIQDYCKDCRAKFLSVLKVMALVNDDANTYMTMARFRPLFEKVLLPLFRDVHFNNFLDNAEKAFDAWRTKFENDHKKI